MIYRIEPLSDPRWNDLVERHPQACVFHSREWLCALERTYGYRPAVLTTSAPGQALENGLVYCEISSVFTGRRLVSLPFSDHCDILASSPEQETLLLSRYQEEMQGTRSKYAEIRPRRAMLLLPSDIHAGDKFYFHELNLRPTEEELFQNFHGDCVRRKIRRSERDGIRIEQGRSEALLESFYQLLTTTRRRHGYPPPPRRWFDNLVDCMEDRLTIRIAFKERIPVAGIVSLAFKDVVVYKYGASDQHHHASGPMQKLFWSLIQDAKTKGLHSLDLGRSALDNTGLAIFKDRWGAPRSQIAYSRFSSRRSTAPVAAWGVQAAKYLFSSMPNGVSQATGNLLYKHVG